MIDRCRCEASFTCKRCLQNTKPYHFTLSSGSAIIPPPVDLGSGPVLPNVESKIGGAS